MRAILCLLIFCPVSAFAHPAPKSVKPPKPKHWSYQATDDQGVFGSGYGDDRRDASSDAILNCQLRSHGSCQISFCTEV